MPGGYHRRRPGGAGWGYGQYYGVAPVAPVIESGCSCKSENGAVGSLETWVKENPILSLIGVFALGMLVSKKKGLF